jgi:tetratricopeptide (TPR) repeat protein
VPPRQSPPPALSTRAPAPTNDVRPSIDRDSPNVELRLAIGKDGLGIELNRAARMACIDVTEIAVVLPGVRFPLDVSGGVSRFRHRRGELRRLGIELDARSLERWAAPRLRGIVSTESPTVWIATRRDAATVGISSREADVVLAFDVTLDTHEDDVRLTVTHARGMALAAPATSLAIAAMRAVLGDRATREGSRFTVARAAAGIARALLPEAGARAPSCAEIRWTMTSAAADAWLLVASDGPQADVGEEAARARESAALTRDGDDARAAGDLTRARALDLAAMDRAPRHPALAARVAEIDAIAGGRAEAAIAVLGEADAEPGAARGPLMAELIAESGDASGAIAAFARIGDLEPVPVLAARSFERAAMLAEDPHDALVWLDLAVARAPAVAQIRWARVSRRLASGRIDDAIADVEHVEAIAEGARAKYGVWRCAGHMWRASGLASDSATLFERALRYLPDDPEALAGLGAALVDDALGMTAGATARALSPRAERRATRGAALLARAIELGESRGDDVSAMTLDLARALAEALGDRPAAIARARAVPNGARCAILARALEGRWRAAVGDVAGASLAWARARDLASTRFEGATGEHDPRDAEAAARLLVEGAEFERETRGDFPSAQRHLASALRLRPRDAEIERAYRDVCARLAPSPLSESGSPEPKTSIPSALPTTASLAPMSATDSLAPEDEARLASRVEDLTRMLQGDPTRDDVVDELTVHLVRLGRSLELFALLSGRLEDATPERRAKMIPAQRAVLVRLEEEARAAGRESEASLYRDARLALE